VHQGIRIVIVCFPDIDSCFSIAGEPVGRTSDQDDVLGIGMMRLEEVLESGGSKAS
jgi:hypothetical protein